MSGKAGRGTITYENGDKYEGDFVDGKAEGQGKYTYHNGDVYEGDWADENPNGCGKMTYHAGGPHEYYVGVWETGKFHGNGTLTFRDGDVYVGGFRSGKLHGEGKMEYYNGDSYDGRFENNKPHGKGTFKWPSGCVYKGELKDDKMHGIGTYKWPNGRKYEGEWKDDKMHGRGTNVYANGDIYTGDWADYKKHGNGTMKSNGKVYCGKWLNDKKHGSGILKEPSGVESKQEYRHGQLLSSKRIATLSNGPPSQRQRTDNAVNNMFLLNEDYTTCDICMEEFSFDRNAQDENTRKRLPVLSSSGACDHWFCHGCIVEEQGRVGGIANSASLPQLIQCMTCRAEGAFCPSEPKYHRMLIDILSSSIPVREETPSVVENDDASD